MFYLAIFLFLTSIVLAWRFRAGILMPVTLFALVVAAVGQIVSPTSVSVVLNLVMFALVPQIGYVVGLALIVVHRVNGAFGSLPRQSSKLEFRSLKRTTRST